MSELAAERTAWTRNLAEPLRAFLRAETASAALLAAAVAVALAWASADAHGYEQTWTTVLTVGTHGHNLTLTLRDWVDSGLMSLFFLVVGLEARREIDVGELREHRRLVMPVAAGAAGMAVPVAIFLAIDGGTRSAHAWGTAMSTDTALALGILAALGRRVPSRLHAFLVTVLVVDDLISMLVLVFGYSTRLGAVPLVLAAVLFAVTVAIARLGVQAGIAYLVLGVATWVALHFGGVDPVVVGIGFGLLSYATPAATGDLERATDLFRLFREQPTAELARAARGGVAAALSPNERLQALYLPWSTYGIVPLFALANAGVPLTVHSLDIAARSRVAIGIVVAYVVGKPVGIAAATALVGRLAPRARPPVGWLSVGAAAAAAAAPFTVSLLIATRALRGEALVSAKLGIVAAAILAPVASAAVVRAAALLPLDWRLRALLGTAQSTVDLAVPVDAERDHIRGAEDASVTLVEYGDFQCPYCGRAEQAIEAVLGAAADVRYVWRHLPLADVHPRAQLAAEAAEAAAAQGRFWELHDVLLERQDALELPNLVSYARELGLDVERFVDDLRHRRGGARIADDVDGAEQSGVAGTPTFFVNGRRHWGAYDVAGLTRAVREARARAAVAASDGAAARRRSGTAVQP